MDFRKLRYFVHIAEMRSFTKAAVALAIAQPALSRQMRELESELGVPLLLRNGRGVDLTAAGLQLLENAKCIIAETERAKRDIQALRGRASGFVRIGMPPAVGSILWLPLVEVVRGCFPEIQLRITEGYSGHISEWLLSGRIDIGILFEPAERKQAARETLAVEDMYLIGRAGEVALTSGSIRFSDLAHLPMIVPGRPHFMRLMFDAAAARHHVELDVVMEVDAFPVIKELVAKGHGFTMLPVAALMDDIDAGILGCAKIVQPTMAQRVELVTSTQHPPTLATREVARAIRGQVQLLVSTGRWPSSRPAESGADEDLDREVVLVSRS